MDRDTASHFVICIKNVGYEDDLKPRRVYQLLPDEAAEASQFVRVVDETCEEYLYPSAYFVPIEVPGEAELVLFLAS